MTRFIGTVSAGTMDFGGLGRAQVQEEVAVEAETEEEARDEIRRLKPGKRIFKVEQVYEFHITLRGHADRRRRNTWIVRARNERDARRGLTHKSGVWRFARYGHDAKSQDAAIVKIERRPV